MVCQAGDKLFCSVRDVYQGPVNDVAVCYDKNSDVHTYYTLFLVKKNTVARLMVQLFEGRDKKESSPYVMSFSQGDKFCFVFDYRPERPVTEFFLGGLRPQHERKQLMQKLVMECIAAAELPYPFLYLILTQNQVNLTTDNTIYFTYLLDLENLDETCGENRCVQETARLIYKLLECDEYADSQDSSRGISSRRIFKRNHYRKNNSSRMLRLIEKKTARLAYSQWIDLYKDLSLTVVPAKKAGILKCWKQKMADVADKLFYILLACCILLVVIAVVSIFIQVFQGEVPWFRIFFNTFQRIGTETLG